MFKVVVKGLTKEFERSYRDYVYGTMAAAATAAHSVPLPVLRWSSVEAPMP